MSSSTLHQLAIGLSLPEKTLLAWNKRFHLQPSTNEQGQLIYSAEQKELILRLHYLIKEQGYTLAGAEQQLKKLDVRVEKERTIKRLSEIRSFLVGLKERLSLDEEEE